jgi:uncharacterized membrane protein YvbJ
MTQCPFCSERVKDSAIKCKHCGEMLHTPEAKSIDREKKQERDEQTMRELPLAFLGVIIFFALLFLATYLGYCQIG